MKKILSMVLVLSMILSMLAINVFASAPVAMIGNEAYNSLEEAVAAANADTTTEGAVEIKLISDTTFDKALTISRAMTITGAKTLSRGAYTGTLFTVPAGSSLTLDGGIVLDGNNNWIFNKELYENDLYNRQDNPISAYAYSAENGTCGTAAAFVVNGTVTVKNVTIQNFFSTKDSNAGDAAIFKVNANATLVTDGALIDHCATYGANTVAHLNTNAKWYIQGETMISNNFGGRNGGICRNDYGTIYMSGGTIKNTAGKNVNGSVFMMYGKGSQFIMTGGTICSNSSVFGVNNGRCAAVYLHSKSYMKMTGGTICHNIGGSRGGIDSYQTNAILDINRVDQDFENSEWKENGAASYTEKNHPSVVDNVSLLGYSTNDVGNTYIVDQWWVTGGIYTQDVDEFCAPGYICIPYVDSAREDDYIVVPGYRVKYYSVSTVETEDKATGDVTTETVTKLEEKRFLYIPKNLFWHEAHLFAESVLVMNEEKGLAIGTWYLDEAMTKAFDFANTEVTHDINLYGAWEEGLIDKTLRPATKKISGKVYLDGVAATADGFTFLLTEKNGRVIDSAVSVDGSFSFGALEFNSPGMYKYYVVQDVPAETGDIKYDTKTLEIEIKVTEDEEKYTAKLSVKHASSVSFYNTTVHTHTEETVAGSAPSCTDAGLTDGTKCSECGETLVAQEEIAAHGHTAGDEVIENVVEATETEGGSYDIVVYCTVCGTELSRETVITEVQPPKDPAPEETTEAPEVTTEPEETTEAPEETTEAPEETTEAPEETTEAPEETTEAPEETTEAPEVTTEAPEETTEAPEETTEAPEETTEAPEVTTEPEEEITEPEEEITEPEIPLAPNPETGDSTLIIAIIAIASIALAALYIKRRQVIED